MIFILRIGKLRGDWWKANLLIEVPSKGEGSKSQVGKKPMKDIVFAWVYPVYYQHMCNCLHCSISRRLQYTFRILYLQYIQVHSLPPHGQ